ncbi:MAG TPA: DUF998 domain-containing protein [Candidatus Saccharimonadales bacterium]|nr:DUF998 domain-containing protein [Candidatus Saccharimonadales bacterium]
MITTTNSINTKNTKLLLLCGTVLAPAFWVVAIIEMFTRSGFNPRELAVSSLSLGSMGWIQVTNFIGAGALALLCAVGLRQVLANGRGKTWGPLLITTYGLGLILAGFFKPDAGFGFPAGAPSGKPASFSPHAMVHSVAFFIIFLSLIASCFVLARRFSSLGQKTWARYSLFTGVVAPILVVLGLGSTSSTGIFFAAAGITAFGWLSVVAYHLSK